MPKAKSRSSSAPIALSTRMPAGACARSARSSVVLPCPAGASTSAIAAAAVAGGGEQRAEGVELRPRAPAARRRRRDHATLKLRTGRTPVGEASFRRWGAASPHARDVGVVAGGAPDARQGYPREAVITNSPPLPRSPPQCLSFRPAATAALASLALVAPATAAAQDAAPAAPALRRPYDDAGYWAFADRMQQRLDGLWDETMATTTAAAAAPTR